MKQALIFILLLLSVSACKTYTTCYTDKDCTPEERCINNPEGIYDQLGTCEKWINPYYLLSNTTETTELKLEYIGAENLTLMMKHTPEVIMIYCINTSRKANFSIEIISKEYSETITFQEFCRRLLPEPVKDTQCYSAGQCAGDMNLTGCSKQACNYCCESGMMKSCTLMMCYEGD